MKTQLLLLASLALAIPAANAIVLYSSNFGGNIADNLNGVALDTSGATGAQHTLYGTSASATWSAATKFKADGTYAGSGTTTQNRLSATVVFTPQNGNVYQLDMTTNHDQGAGGDWFATGFYMQPNYIGNTNAAGGGTVWALTRPSSTLPQQAFFSGGGVTVGTPTYDTTVPSTLRIVLDTTLGTGNWSATYYVSDNAGGFNLLGSVADLEAVDIESVGIGVYNTTHANSKFQAFELSVIPEPSAALLGGLGMLALLRRRR